jgi:hypothetical protein
VVVVGEVTVVVVVVVLVLVGVTANVVLDTEAPL